MVIQLGRKWQTCLVVRSHWWNIQIKGSSHERFWMLLFSCFSLFFCRIRFFFIFFHHSPIWIIYCYQIWWFLSRFVHFFVVIWSLRRYYKKMAALTYNQRCGKLMQGWIFDKIFKVLPRWNSIPDHFSIWILAHLEEILLSFFVLHDWICFKLP